MKVINIAEREIVDFNNQLSRKDVRNMRREMIVNLRKMNNLSQRDFANIVNCSFSLIALVEVGKRRITSNLEKKIIESFNLSDKQMEELNNSF